MNNDLPPAGEEESGIPAELLCKKELHEYWLQMIKHFYPDHQKRPYCVPPVFFKRVPYEEQNVAEQRVLVPSSPSNEHPVSCKDSSELGPLPTSPDCSERFPNIPEDTTPTAGRVWSGMSEQADPSLLKVTASDMRSDDAQEQVLGCLMEFFGKQASRKQGVFVISELNFQDYLGEKSYVAAARASEQALFPRPRGNQYMRKGDFDILVIHRQHGILAGEIKSVGSWRGGDQGDVDVTHKVKKAAEQMKKSENLVNHLLSDLEFKPPIKMTLILPSVKRCRLQEILGRKENQKTLKALCKGLGLETSNADTAVEMCLCEEEIQETDPSLRMDGMRQWWHRRMPVRNDCSLTKSLYDDVLARFCGPATTVYVRCITRPRLEVRTLGQAVSELGERLACLVLTYRQVELLSSRDRLVLLTGPPGTGKTVVLTLRGLQWLQDGHTVHVVSTRPESFGISSLVFHQLQRSCQEASPTATPRVMLHNLDFCRKNDMEAVVKTLEEKAENGHLYIIADEYGSNKREKAICYQFFPKELCKRVPHLHFWAAVLRRGTRSKLLKVRKITDPLRSAPIVQREVQQSFKGLKDVYPYSDKGVPSPWDGPEVVRLRHGGKSHQGRWPTDCRQCGRDIGEKLRELGVGVKEAWPTSAIPAMVMQRPQLDSSTAPTMHPVNENTDDLEANARNSSSAAFKDLEAPTTPRLATTATPTTPETLTKGKAVRRPDPLSFRDVFVLTNNSDLQDDVESGHVNGVVMGMREAGIEVRVVRSKTKDPEGWKLDAVDTATAVTDHVTFSHMGDVSGLERKVVVWLPGLPEGVEKEASARKQEEMGYLYAISRCSVQAIVVDVSPDTLMSQVDVVPDVASQRSFSCTQLTGCF